MKTTEHSQESTAEADAPVHAIAPGKQTRTGAGQNGNSNSFAWGSNEAAHRAGDWEADDSFLSAIGMGAPMKADATPTSAPVQLRAAADAPQAKAAPPAKAKGKGKPAHPPVTLELGDHHYTIVDGVLMSGREALGEIEDAKNAVGKLGKSAPGQILFKPGEGGAGPAAGDLVAAAPEGSTIRSGTTSWVKNGGAWHSFATKIKKGSVKGFSKYGGGSVRERLTEMARAGQVKLSGEQVAVIAAMAEVETGGQIGCVQTYDDQVVSVGFKQVVLGHGSLEKIITQAPAGFAKHGIVIDYTRTYVKKGWDKQPHQFAGCDDVEELRSPEWAIKFYFASMEPDVVAAISTLALAELKTVEKTIDAADDKAGHDFFDDVVAKAWMLEVYNNRPAFMAKAAEMASSKPAANRDAFLDVLAESIIETYKIEEPKLAHRKALKAYKKKHGKEMSAEASAELLVAKQAEYTPIGERKGTNIVTKIPRSLTAADVGAASTSVPTGAAAFGGATAGAASAATVTTAPPRPAPAAQGPTTAAKPSAPKAAAAVTATESEDDSLGFDDLMHGLEMIPLVIGLGLAHLASNAPAGGAPAAGGTKSGGDKGGDKAGPASGQPAQAGTRAAPAPLPVSSLGNPSLEQLVAKINNAEVTAIAGQLAALKAESKGLARDRREEQGEGRDQLVEHIGALRTRIEGLPKGNADIAAFKAAIYRAIQDLAPFYFQSRNIDILETPPASATRTCNLTVLGMSLESLGLSAANYTGHRASLLAAARFYQHKIVGDDKSEEAHGATAGRGASWENVAGLRLPDFLELAAIARHAGGATDEAAVKAGAKEAWNSILEWQFLKDLASDFKVNAHIKMFNASGIKTDKKAGTKSDDKKIRSLGDKNRMAVEKYINARLAAEAKGSEKNLAARDKLQAGYDAAIADEGIDDQVSISDFRDHLVKEVGKDLDAGKAVIVGLSGHFVKLQSLDENHIIVDDPARDTRSGTVLSYAEARAMGYFHMRFVLS